MESRFLRTELLLGENASKKLRGSKILIFGAGGVGGFTIEALARCGIHTIGIVDNDTVSESNINRQIIATSHTIGQPKVDLFEARIKDISPHTEVKKFNLFYLPNMSSNFDFSEWDYIVDAIDTVKAKIDIIERSKNANTPIISSMGCGNRLDPTQLQVTDIYNTQMDPLSKIMRRELRKRQISSLKVVYSPEQPIVHSGEHTASISFVPSTAGLIIASVVVNDIISM